MLRRQVISFKQTFLLICLIISLVTSKIEKNNRKRRDILNSNSFLTIYYICGTYPSTILSIIRKFFSNGIKHFFKNSKTKFMSQFFSL